MESEKMESEKMESEKKQIITSETLPSHIQETLNTRLDQFEMMYANLCEFHNELLNVENASSEEVLEMYQKFNEIEQRYIDLYYRMQPQNGDKSSMEAYDEIDEHFVLGNSAFEFILTYHTIKNAPDDKKQIYIDLETYCNLKLRELPRNIESAIVFMHTNRNQFVNLCNSFEHHHVNSMLV
jgi:hypothetical protein